MRIETLNELAKGLIDRLPEMELSGEALATYRWIRIVLRIQLALIALVVCAGFWKLHLDQEKSRMESAYVAAPAFPAEIPPTVSTDMPDLETAMETVLQHRRLEENYRLLLLGWTFLLLAILLLTVTVYRRVGRDRISEICVGIRNYRCSRRCGTMILTRK